MTQAELIELGVHCEFLLSDPQFNTLVQNFEHETGKQILATPPSKKEDREALYHTFNGLRDFLSYMTVLAHESRKLRNEQDQTEQPSTSQDLPDDVVFDLYREETRIIPDDHP